MSGSRHTATDVERGVHGDQDSTEAKRETKREVKREAEGRIDGAPESGEVESGGAGSGEVESGEARDLERVESSSLESAPKSESEANVSGVSDRELKAEIEDKAEAEVEVETETETETNGEAGAEPNPKPEDLDPELRRLEVEAEVLDLPELTFPEPKDASLVISADDHETRCAYLVDYVPTEFFFDRSQEVSLVGNIYKGRVVRVLSSMQAAFVDIGLKQAAFLYIDDVVGARDSYQPHSSTMISESAAGSTYTHTIDLETGSTIHKLIQEGQELMVQVSKDPISTKGARVTSHISIAGRHLVYIPLFEHIGISRRITQEEERQRLQELLAELIPQGGGFVARTAAEGCSIEDLREDLNYLRQVWNEVLTRMESLSSPATLYEDLDLPLKVTRDLATPNLREIVIDQPDTYKRLHSFVARFMPNYLDKVRLYEDHEPLYEAYGIEAELNRALSRQVWLPSGGYLVIDQTEAFTAIDVNSGRFVGKFHFEETIYRTNIEAVREVVHQLQLRNLGGIIIIDLIDMERASMRHRVFTTFLDALKRDRAKTNVSKISNFGLIEMTRKRVRDSLLRTVCEPCIYCQGTGFLKSPQTIAHQLYREVISGDLSEAERASTLHVELHPHVAQLFEGSALALVADLESRLDLEVSVSPNSALHLESYRLSYR